ncbi:MAG: hypothetical protein HYT70_00650 [Candidatus Aenigmarchaeota archaeon]|nr:hypothetical protein [Candidatus Aenigmarchaeota archaeon]
MPTFFETAVLKLNELGFFKFLLPFILTAAIIYGGLRRSQIFGDPDRNVAVNAVISFVVSLFVWATPIILGVDIQTRLTAFFVQGFVVSLVVLFGLLIAGMFFPPDLAKSLGEKIKSGYFWGAIIILSFLVIGVVAVSSGLATVMFPEGVGAGIPSDLFISAGIILLLVVSVAFIVQTAK